MACAGEVLVIIGAMIWITGTPLAHYLFAAGATIFAIGRFNEKQEKGSIVLARLYGQRTFGVIALLITAVFPLGIVADHEETHANMIRVALGVIEHGKIT